MTQSKLSISENVTRMIVAAGCFGFLCLLLFADSWLGMIPLALIFLWLLVSTIRRDATMQQHAVGNGSN